MLTVGLDRSAAQPMRSSQYTQSFDVDTPPLGSSELGGIAIRIDQRVPQLFQPVCADEALQVGRAEVECEPPAVGAIQLETPGARLRKELLGHDRGKARARALAHLLRTQMKEVEQRKAPRTGRRPIH